MDMNSLGQHYLYRIAQMLLDGGTPSLQGCVEHFGPHLTGNAKQLTMMFSSSIYRVLLPIFLDSRLKAHKPNIFIIYVDSIIIFKGIKTTQIQSEAHVFNLSIWEAEVDGSL